MAENVLPPVSWASVIIGFISFAFTLSTFFRIIAGNLSTLSAAPHEVPFYLSNLKQELFEERVHLRRARRRAERSMRHMRRNGQGMASWDSAPAIRLLEGTVRHLCKQFKDLEKPFLKDTPGDQGNGAKDNVGTLEAGVREREAHVWDDYMDGGFDSDYGTVSFYHRFAWLKRKTQFFHLANSLERLQIRRIGRETTDSLNELKRLKLDLQDLKLIPADSEGGGGGGGGGARSRHGHSRVVSGTRRRRSTFRGRGRADSISTSASSESSDDQVNEKTQRVHVRRTSRYRV